MCSIGERLSLFILYRQSQSSFADSLCPISLIVMSLESRFKNPGFHLLNKFQFTTMSCINIEFHNVIKIETKISYTKRQKKAIRFKCFRFGWADTRVTYFWVWKIDYKLNHFIQCNFVKACSIATKRRKISTSKNIWS